MSHSVMNFFTPCFIPPPISLSIANMGPKADNKPEGDTQGEHHVHSRTVTTGTTHVTLPGPTTPSVAPVTPMTLSRTQIHSGTTPTYYIQHAPISIQAAKLDTRSFEKIEPLDQGKNNWPDWSFTIKLVLNQHLVGGYLTSNVIALNPLTEPGTHNNWSLNNITIISALWLLSSSLVEMSEKSNRRLAAGS
ncbi:hypothetical protein BDN67DRAFT_984915 [Paxillus ammoniavirescens]|nr:hypothetical protein BDN67DRAFT_984915 [Paxillus ammoniavirescens]